MPITQLAAGLAIIQSYDSAAPVVTSAYIVTVPAVKVASMSQPHKDALDAAGWLEHPLYLSYYYPSKTLTELANVTGEAAKKVPVFEPYTPSLPFTQ